MKPSVCLIDPPSKFLINEKVFPNLGILYVASALKLQGFDIVDVHDGPIEDIPKWHDVYAVGGTTPQFPDAVEVLNHIRTFKGRPRAYIGGPHATIDPQSCLEKGFDGVVMKEGEIGLRVAIDYKCRMVEAPVFTEVHPDRSLIDIHSYRYEIDGIPATSIMTSRGCPYHCGFCCKTKKGVSLFPAEFVLEELRELKDTYGFKAFMFFDDIFVLDKERLITILNEIKKWGVIWRCFARADVLVRHGQDTIRLMAEAGCREVGMGIESGSDRILKTIHKGEDTETIRTAIRMLNEEGVRIKGFFIVGLPSESWLTIRETINFIESVKLDDVDFTLFSPYKKSDIYENKQMYDIHWDNLQLQNSWYKGKSDEYMSQVSTSEMTKEDLVLARKQLERRFKHWKQEIN